VSAVNRSLPLLKGKKAMLNLNIIKVVTAKNVFWAVDGKVTTAKSRQNGRFIKRDFCQDIPDNMMLLACNVTAWESKTGNIPTTANVDYREFCKTILFFGIEVFKPWFIDGNGDIAWHKNHVN
jgi:hypothetical protein